MIKPIHIVLSSSNEFLPHCAAAMASILYNLSDEYQAHFYILSYDITDKNKQKLKKLNKIKPCKIQYPQFDEKILDMFNGIKIPPHVTKMTYARILIPDILPDVDRVLFVDSDMIVRTDISQLYDLDIGQNVFAAVEDFNWRRISKNLWGTEEYYFNAGLLFVNSKKLREINYLDLIKKQIALNGSRYTICDQDVINDTFRGQIYRLSLTWNFYHGVLIKRFRGYIPDNMDEFNAINANPNIVHYVGPEKPWLPSVEHPYEQDYFFYSRLTPFYHLWRKQKYTLYNTKVKSITFHDFPIYMRISENGKKVVKIFKKEIHLFRKIGSPFFSVSATNSDYKLKVLGLPLLHKKDTKGKRYIKVLGIPFYYVTDKTFLIRDNQAFLLKQMMITKANIDKMDAQLKEQKSINLQLKGKLSNLKCIIEAQKLHEKTFGPYKNAFAGRDVVMVCTGPTANKYKMIPNAIHIGINGAIYLKNVSLDYLFVQDFTIHQKNNSTLNADANEYKGNDCKKFYGIIPDDRLAITHDYVERIPLNYCHDSNISQYLLEDIPFHNIAYDLSREPLGEFSGTPFSVLQFIFYTNPKRLYLVGWDCGAGYAYGKKNAINPANYQIDILKKYFLPFIQVHCPNMEIVSINPVGLKGIFKDEYTEE